MQMSSAFPPMTYKFYINFFSIPTALAAKSDLHIDFHEFEEKIT